MPKKKKFVLVAGNPRSGTTFVGKMLALPRSVMYLAEPFNTSKGLVPGISTDFPYISKSGKDDLSKLHKRVSDDFLAGATKFLKKHEQNENASLKNKVGSSVFGSRNNYEYKMLHNNPAIKTGIIKDPTASLLAEYMHNEHGVPVVIMLRHPGAVVASFKKYNMRHPVANLHKQPALADDYLAKITKGLDLHSLNFVEEAAWHWNCINHVLLDFAKRNPKMIVVRHEDVSKHPIAAFKKLYNALELPFTHRVEKLIQEHTSAHNPTAAPEGVMHQLKRNSKENISSWQNHLSDEEKQLIKTITAPISNLYYSEQTWG